MSAHRGGSACSWVPSPSRRRRGLGRRAGRTGVDRGAAAVRRRLVRNRVLRVVVAAPLHSGRDALGRRPLGDRGGPGQPLPGRGTRRRTQRTAGRAPRCGPLEGPLRAGDRGLAAGGVGRLLGARPRRRADVVRGGRARSVRLSVFSRRVALDEASLAQAMALARRAGFDVGRLTRVVHDGTTGAADAEPSPRKPGA